MASALTPFQDFVAKKLKKKSGPTNKSVIALVQDTQEKRGLVFVLSRGFAATWIFTKHPELVIVTFMKLPRV